MLSLIASGNAERKRGNRLSLDFVPDALVEVATKIAEEFKTYGNAK